MTVLLRLILFYCLLILPGCLGRPVPLATKIPAGKEDSELISRSVLFGNASYLSPQLSPDGRFLAWLQPREGVMNIWVSPRDDRSSARPVTSEAHRPIRGFVWSYDSQYLLYRQDPGGDENSHLFRVRLINGAVTDLTPFANTRAELLDLSPSRPGVALIGLNQRDPRMFDVYEVEIASGRLRRILTNKEGFISFVFDSELHPRFAAKVTSTGGKQVFARRVGAWELYDELSLDDAQSSSTLTVSKDGKRRYLLDSRGRDTAAFVVEDIWSRKGTTIFEAPHFDVSQVVFHPIKRDPQALVVVEERKRWVVLDAALKQDFKRLQLADPGALSILSRTLDDTFWTVSFSSDVSPERYYLYDRSQAKLLPLFDSRPELDSWTLRSMRPVQIPTRDGLQLVGYLTVPAEMAGSGVGVAERPGPLVLLVHGGPWLRDTWGFNAAHQLLADRGYAVLSVNFRGSAGFGKRFLTAGNREWGRAMQRDLEDAVSWAVSQGVTERGRVCIMGSSYGGYAALAGVTLTPGFYTCAVSMVGPSNLVTLMESFPPYWEPLRASNRERIGDVTTESGRQELFNVSPLSHVDKIERPLLIAHGANDPRVKRTESDQIVEAMKRREIPVTYLLFPDEGHGLARPENQLAFWGVAERFLAKNLGGRVEPLGPEERDASSMQILASDF